MQEQIARVVAAVTGKLVYIMEPEFRVDPGGERLIATSAFPDSPLEGDGFELSVPGRETVKPSWETGLLSRKRERICWGTESSKPSPSSGESGEILSGGNHARPIHESWTRTRGSLTSRVTRSGIDLSI